MKKVITKFFSKWKWSFLLFASSTVLLMIYLLYTEEISNINLNLNYFLGLVTLILFSSSLLLLLISSLHTIIRKKWIITTLVILIIFVGGVYGAKFSMDKLITKFQPDGFADNLIIPDNIDLNIPRDERLRGEFRSLETKDIQDFELYHTELFGIYEFTIWTEKIEKGTVYLKAYEITGEHSLSASEIRQNSALKISNPTNEIKEFGPSTFMIKEGDWGKFYAARFEVWFSPDKTSKGERKLMEKIYKIEGYSN